MRQAVYSRQLLPTAHRHLLRHLPKHSGQPMGTHPIKPPKLFFTCFIQEALPFLSLVLLFCLSGQKEGHDIVFSQIWQLGEFFRRYSPIIPLIKYLELPRSETRLVLQILLLMLVSGSEHIQEGVILLPDIPK
jgi:hypothetical protein